MVLEELVAVLTFEIDDKPLKKFNEGIASLTTSIGAVVGAAVGAGGTLFAFAQSAANAGDEVGKASQKFGVSTGALQELMFAARGEAEILTHSMGFLSKSINAATEAGSPMSKTFAQMGIKVKDATGKLLPTEDVIMRLSDTFANMPDGAQKSALAMEVFGKQGAALIPFLNQGSEEIAKLREEAVALGVVMSEDDIKAAEAFNDSIDDLLNTVAGLRNFLGAKLFPVIKGIVTRFQEFVKVNRAVIATRIEKFFEVLANVTERAWNILSALLDSAMGVAEIFGGMGNVISAAATAMMIFAGASILYNLGKMVGLVLNLGNAITLANAKALLIPILIGAAIVAIGLIIEDIIAFFQGRDSVTGIMVEKFKEAFAFLEQGFNNLGSVAKTAIAIILTPVRALLNGFQSIIDIIDVVRGKMKLGDALGNIGNRALNTLGFGATDSLRGAMGLPAMASAPTASAAAGVVPSMGEVMSSGSSQSTQQNNIEMPITVSVGQNASPFEVGREVQKQAGGSLQEILRGAQRSYAGQGSY